MFFIGKNDSQRKIKQDLKPSEDSAITFVYIPAFKLGRKEGYQ